jgi:hypothetical protein
MHTYKITTKLLILIKKTSILILNSFTNYINIYRKLYLYKNFCTFTESIFKKNIYFTYKSVYFFIKKTLLIL